MHKVIKRNKIGRDFIIGDLHGRYDLLQQAMKDNNFDKKTDRIFSVGDIINRGSESEKCLKLLNKPWFFMVLGNHEASLIEAVNSDALKSYARNVDDWVKKVPKKDMKKWAKVLSKCPIAITLKSKNYSVGICHAEPDGRHWRQTRDSQKSRFVMLMGRRVLQKRPKTNVKGIDFTVHGHTPLHKTKWVGNRYFIDTGAWYSDTLTFKALDEVFKDYSKRLSA